MNRELLEKLSAITDEEQKILDGKAGVEKKLYASGEEFTIDSAKLLEARQLITVRTHTRFVHFPLHRHNYVEMMYVCEGSITHFIGDREITVRKGELILLNQYTKHEIAPAGERDIAINFVVLPEFFDVALEMIGRNNVLADFIVNTLRQNESKGEYLYFRVADSLQIQNLIENMVYSLVMVRAQAPYNAGVAGFSASGASSDHENLISGHQATVTQANQTTMGLIFLYLLDYASNVDTMLPDQYENMITMATLRYIDQNYKTASLKELCRELHLPDHTLSKMIKKSSGCNFIELLQRKRLGKAVNLLCDTDLPINDIIDAVGYENHSYFHRIFRERYGMTPRTFRMEHKKDTAIRI